jgi:Tol biopolymer transport system component
MEVEMSKKVTSVAICICTSVFFILSLFMNGCSDDNTTDSQTRLVPHEGSWGLYALDLASQDVSLLYSTGDEIVDIDLSNSGTRLAFSIKKQSGVDIDTTSEIYTLNIIDGAATRITDNYFFDSYPSYSPDDSRIVFLSERDGTLDLYVMDTSGADQQLLYNSGGHDADVDWGSAGRIAFTRDYQIWSILSNGTDPRQLTDPPGAGTWGNANLPIGDYDPRISPDGNRVAFERLVDVGYVHGGYNIYTIDMDGTGEAALTNNGSQGYAQGFPNWSHAGDKLVYILAAVGSEGRYDMYTMNTDGSENHSIMPGYFPPEFICRNAVFSLDDKRIYFIGQWYSS